MRARSVAISCSTDERTAIELLQERVDRQDLDPFVGAPPAGFETNHDAALDAWVILRDRTQPLEVIFATAAQRQA